MQLANAATQEISGQYNVGEDKIDETNKNHFIYACYGYSGSGKTHTLIKDSEYSILHQILKKNNNKQIKLKICDLYGESKPTGHNQIESHQYDVKNMVETYYKATVQSENAHQNIEITTEENGCFITGKIDNLNIKYDDNRTQVTVTLNDLYDELIKFRKNPTNYVSAASAANAAVVDFYTKENIEPAKYRVRATPNNPESSRAHLFIQVFIDSDSDQNPSYTIIDMGGSEDVEQIQNSYYIKTGGLYDIPRIQENLRQIQTKFDGFFRKLQPNTLSDPSNIVIYNKTDDNISCVIRSGNKTKVHPSTDDTKVVLPNLILFTLENDSSNVINYGNWENFVYDDDNGGNTSLIDHYTTFVLSNIRMEYNQYVKLYEVASTFLKTSITKLREATCIQEIANCKQSLYPKKGKINENYYHKKGKINENYYHKNKTWRNLAFKIWNYTMQIIIKILNAVFLKVDINFNSDTITYEATTNFLDVKMKFFLV